MATTEQLENTFVMLFQDYKQKLFDLGVEIRSIPEKTLLKWFRQHLDDIEKGRDKRIFQETKRMIFET